MAEFKRVISYIHLYENMQKGKNIGFVKTDVHDGLCRIEVHLNNVYTNGKEMCEIYSLQKDGKGYLVDHFPVEHHMGECHLKRDGNQIDDHGNQVHELEGFAFKLSEDRLALSFFKKDEPQFEKVSIAGRIYGRNGIAEAEKVSEKNQEQEQDISLSVSVEGEEKPQAAEPEEMPEEVTQISDLEVMPETEQAEPEEEKKEPEQDSSVITPFEDVTKYVFYKISPEHLVNLAPEYEIMQHNSFLLHGYYNYQYLIIGQKEEDRWILGVPGVYHEREQMMASMFGFPEFKGARKGKVTAGAFGYYLKEVRVDIHSWKLNLHPEETQKAYT